MPRIQIAALPDTLAYLAAALEELCKGLALVEPHVPMGTATELRQRIAFCHAPMWLWAVIWASAFLFGNAFPHLEDIERKLAKLPPE